MSGRNTFTARDEDFLAQYIAKYNPEPKGRSGNVLYRRLVDNENGKWPWAQRHSWHSWRDYYLRNRPCLDHRIAKHAKRPATPQPSQPHSQPTPGSQAKRAPFTREDDQNIIDFLANVSSSLGAFKGQKLWMMLVDDLVNYPWAVRHSEQSWRERYVKNAQFFNRKVKEQRGEPVGDDERDIPWPKTADQYQVRRRSSQTASSARADKMSPEKRKRASDAVREAPPEKRKRVEVTVPAEDEPSEAGPSRHREEDAEESLEVEHEARLDVVEENEEVPESGREGGTDEDDHDEEEVQGPIGSDDYQGQIFDSPGQPEKSADASQDRASSSESGQEQEELLHMLTDDHLAGAEDDEEMEVDNGGEQTTVETKPLAACSSPPERRHHPRIDHAFHPAPGTPALSPTDEAQARHHLEHDHSPAPARKHILRIRQGADEEFFGTPQSKTPSTSGTGVSSPTAHRLARTRKKKPVEDDDEDDVGPAKQREPPRLEEGAWTKAFSDVRGRSRISGTGRRKSGVDFEDEAQLIGVQDADGSPDGDDEEDAPDATLVQWPPVRRKHKTAAPSTPVARRSPKDKGKARADAGTDRTVRTEQIVSVKTVRTVERRVPRASNGTPYIRGALAAAAQDEDSGSEDGARAEPEPSQHHPFSQLPLAPRMAASTSSRSISSNPPLPMADVLRLQRLLSGQGRDAPQPSPSKAERDSRQGTSRPDTIAPRGHAVSGSAIPPRARAAPSRETISPPGAIRDNNGGRFDKFQQRDEELPTGPAVPAVSSSPFADKGEQHAEGRPIPKAFFPQATSSRVSGTDATLRVDKGKEKTTNASHAVRHARRHTLAGFDTHDALLGPSHDIPAVGPSTRRSVPSAFTIGDDLPRSALSLLFNPPRPGPAHPGSYSLGHPPGSGSSRSMSPYMSADVATAKRLPPNELDLVLEIGIGQVFRIMAENHGFGEPTVRDVFAATGSLEQTDRLLCKMRESANKTANQVLQSLDGDDDDQDDFDAGGDEKEDEDPEQDEAESADEDDRQSEADEDTLNSRRPIRKEEEEVEHVIEGDSWMQDDAPLAESSRFDVSHSHRESSFGPNPRKSKPLVIKRVPLEPPAPVEYSPPKRTRAGKHIARQSLSRALDTMDVDSPVATYANANGGSPDFQLVQPTAVGLGHLAKYSHDQWRRLGSGGAKVATGKALAKLLQ